MRFDISFLTNELFLEKEYHKSLNLSHNDLTQNLICKHLQVGECKYHSIKIHNTSQS